MKKIAVFASGSGSNFQQIIDRLDPKDGKVELLVSDQEKAGALERAAKANIEALVFNSAEKQSAQRVMEQLEEKKIDLIVLAGYLKIVPPDMVARYKNKIVNIHPSLIPAFSGEGFYGLKVHQKAIEYGVKVSGATVHFVDEQADTGPVILQRCVAVDHNDTPESLQKKVLGLEHEMLIEAVRLFCRNQIDVIGRKVYIKS
ncbi:MAG TPA: phosphoribosylglycinamide formyltransferase [Eubacteriaceae bacterium]|nr:phosphoribosylglycinamide formyltransferase [Eubacteriaceae bacterium]